MWTKTPSPGEWAHMKELGLRMYILRQTLMNSLGTVGAGTLLTFAVEAHAPTALTVTSVGATLAVWSVLISLAQWRAGERAYRAHGSAFTHDCPEPT